MAKRFGFGKNERLKSRKQIEALFLSGQRFTQFPLRITYQLHPAASTPAVKVGVTAMKKHFKKAVDRNRVKRLLREAYRLQKTELVAAVQERQYSLSVFFMYTDKTIGSFDQIKEAMGRSLVKLQKAAQAVEDHS